MDREEAKKETVGDRWRKSWPILLGVIVYMIPLFWMWNKIGYPDGFGVHISAHGKAGLIENWWYSYLLLKRHRVWDLVTFIYMWSAIAGAIWWIFWMYRQERKASKSAANPADAIISPR